MSNYAFKEGDLVCWSDDFIASNFSREWKRKGKYSNEVWFGPFKVLSANGHVDFSAQSVVDENISVFMYGGEYALFNYYVEDTEIIL